MHEVLVHRGQVAAAVRKHVHQLLAHAHQRDGAAGRQIETPEQLLPARLGGGVDFRCGLIAGLFLPGGDGGLHAGMIRPETARPSASKKAMRGPVVSVP